MVRLWQAVVPGTLYPVDGESFCLARELLHTTFIELGILVKLSKLIKVCLNETCGEVPVVRHLCNAFPIQNDLKT
jgi:hypothetical protein